MAYAQKLVFSWILLFAFNVQADWRAVFERAGFIGKYALGTSYEFNQEHAVDLLLGTYQIEHKNYYQTNLIYRYSRWNIAVDDNNWRPLQIGLFTLRSWDREHYFVKSPSQYPGADYYEETAFRWGFEFGTTFTFKPSRFAFAYRVRILDNGLIAIYNNARRDLQYYISSGISLQYVF